MGNFTNFKIKYDAIFQICRNDKKIVSKLCMLPFFNEIDEAFSDEKMYLPINITTISLNCYIVLKVWRQLHGKKLYSDKISALVGELEYIYNPINIMLDDFFLSNNKAIQEDIVHDFFQNYYSKLIKEIYPDCSRNKGTVYTPSYIIEAIMKGIEIIGKINFEMFNSGKILYDPCMGALNFEVILVHMLNSGEWSTFFGSELDKTSYFVGRCILEEYGAVNKLKGIPNILAENIFLDNSLGLSSILINKFREKFHPDTHPLIIFGNPPYSVSSSNKDEKIHNLMQEYSVSEPNITRLYDDYVKFIRFSHHLLEKWGHGIIGFITNRKFLDGKIFYGMRKSLVKFFDSIYIIDLFGDSRNVKGGESGENIFDIQTGVAISIFVKKKIVNTNKNCDLYYYPLKTTITEIKKKLQRPFKEYEFEKIIPEKPRYLFVPVNIEGNLKKMWEKECIPIKKCFKVCSRALISSRDKFMINLDEENLKDNISLLKERNYPKLRDLKRMKSTQDKILENEEIVSTFDLKEMQNSIIPINYRPFDKRHVIYYVINKRCGKSIILDHLVLSNDVKEKYAFCAFNFVHSMQKPPFSHIFFTKGLVDSGIFGYSTSQCAPLWLITNHKIDHNLSDEILEKIRNIVPSAEINQIYGYIYGVLNHKEFMNKFEPILFHELPRVRIPPSKEYFYEISQRGIKLMDLHQNFDCNEKLSNFKYNSKNIEKLQSIKLKNWKFDLNQGILTLNNESSQSLSIFLSIDAWKYSIGSVKILQNWLKARKYQKINRSLSNNEIFLFKQIVTIIEETLSICNFFPVINNS